MPKKEYEVKLTDEERTALIALTKKGTIAARKLARAHILRYQLLDDVREPLPPLPGKPAREDCEYEREGTCDLFLFVEPNIGWRHVEVTKRRTKQDFAQAMKNLVDVYFPEAPLIQVVLDNFNTHTPASDTWLNVTLLGSSSADPTGKIPPQSSLARLAKVGSWAPA